MFVLTILQIAIGIGFLIFVHELGHFLAAKWSGVRVEAFSIGFGPKLLGVRHGDTEYKLSLIPLGGFVKMAGELPGEETSGAPDEFTSQSVGNRAIILSAGVVMNLLFGFLISVWSFQFGVRFIEPLVGEVVLGGSAWQGGMRAGDRIVSIDDTPVMSFSEVGLQVAFGDPKGMDMVVERKGQRVPLRVRPVYNEQLGFQSIGVQNAASLVLNVSDGSPAARAGLRSGDRLLTIDQVTVKRFRDLRFYPRMHPQDTYTIGYERDGKRGQVSIELERMDGSYQLGLVQGSLQVEMVQRGSIGDRVGLQPGDRIVRMNQRLVGSSLTARHYLLGLSEETRVEIEMVRGEAPHVLEPLSASEAIDLLESFLPSFETVRIGYLTPGLPAAASGLAIGDEIVAIDEKPVTGFVDLVAAVGRSEGRELELRYRRDQEEGTVRIRPEKSLHVQPMGLSVSPLRSEPIRYGILEASRVGFRHSINNFKWVLMTLKGLMTRRVAARNLGGPILIAQVSYSSVNQLGFGRFLYFLGLLSINLAIINLLPIPVLDGGHLFFLIIEKIRGEPVSAQVLIGAQMIGLVLIVSLLVFVTFHDIRRLIFGL